MSVRFAYAIAALLCPITAAWATPRIVVGTVELQPNQPGQTIQIFVTGSDPVQGLDLNVQIADGGPELDGEIDGPAITDLDIFTDAIFGTNNTGDREPVPVGQFPQFVAAGTTTASGEVLAEGLLATLTIDTTGFTEGSFDLILSDTLNGPTDFAGVPLEIVDGTITVLGTGNENPLTADAGEDQTVEGGELVQLAGTGSGGDPEVASLSYLWTQIGGPTITLSDPTLSNPTFLAPIGLTNSQITLELSVFDGTTTATDTVAVAVNADNAAPTANAGADQRVEAGQEVQLNGSGTDPEAQSLTYQWIQTTGVTVILGDDKIADPTFTAPTNLANTALVFQLRVSDGIDTSADTVTITINVSNDAPTADAGPDQSVTAGDTVQLAGIGSDHEEQTLTYQWRQIAGPAVILSDDEITDPTFTAPQSVTNTSITFELRVSDGTTTSADNVTITVNVDAADIAADAGLDQTVIGSQTVQLAGSDANAIGQQLTYTWTQTDGIAVVLSDATTANPTFTAPEGADNRVLTFELRVYDGTTTSVDTVSVTVNPNNQAPIIDAGEDQTVDAGDTVQLTGQASDPQALPLIYRWIQMTGTNVELSDNTLTNPTFTAPSVSTDTDIQFEFRVSNGTDISADTVTITVNATTDTTNNQSANDSTTNATDETQQEPDLLDQLAPALWGLTAILGAVFLISFGPIGIITAASLALIFLLSILLVGG